MNNTNKGVERHQTAILCQYNSTVSNHVPLGMKPRRRKRGKGESAERLRTKKKKLSAEQVNLLEMNFETEQKLECARKDRLAAELGLDPRQVAVWFQNRRVRWKSKQLEEDSSMLKNINEILMEEKWHLEAEVSNLKEQLLEAEKEIHRLSERSGIASEGERQCSPRSTSSSADNHPFLGGFNMDDNFGFLFMAQTSYVSDMEWINFGF